MVVSELDRLLCFGSYEDVKSYVQQNPQSIREPCPERGTLPVHRIFSDPQLWYRDEEWQVSFPPENHHRILHRQEKLALLMELYPGGLTVQDAKNGQVPLHAAVVDGRDEDDDEAMELLASVFRACPAASQVRDLRGCTPLEIAIRKRNFDQAHYLLQNHWGAIAAVHKGNMPILEAALQYYAPTDFLRLLICKVDRCAQVKDSFGDLPLHTSIDNGMPYEVVEMIMKAYPRALKVVDSENMLPLSLELKREARYDVVRLLAEEYPKAASRTTHKGLLPIHYAVENRNVTTEILEFLKDQYPNGLTAVLPNGDTVLHHALGERSTSEVAVNWLVKNCPSSIRAVNNELQYPLHLATRWNLADPEFIRMLLNHFPQAARLPDKDGSLPLHEAAVYAEQDIIEVILDAFPEGIRHCNNFGNLPLHLASYAISSNQEKLDFLIEKYPEALTVYNKEGNMPFHCACLRIGCKATEVTKVEHLINRMAFATLPPTKAGVHPLLKACEYNKVLDIIWKLVQHSPEMFQVRNDRVQCAESSSKKRRVFN